MHYYVTEAKLIYSATGNLVDPETYYGKLNQDYIEETSNGTNIEITMQKWRERDTEEYRDGTDVEYKKQFSI